MKQCREHNCPLQDICRGAVDNETWWNIGEDCEIFSFVSAQTDKIFALENRLKECENGYEGTLFLDRCKLHDAEKKVKELTEKRKDFEIRALRAENEATKYKDRYETEKQAREQLSESYDHLEKTKDELLAERSRLILENERLRKSYADYEETTGLKKVREETVRKMQTAIQEWYDRPCYKPTKKAPIKHTEVQFMLSVIGQIAKEMLEGE